MAEETDGVGETFDDSLRIALTVASQFGERISRLREQMSRTREAAAQQEYRELENRFEAERGAARASLEPVRHAEWWDSAKVDDIALVHETATVWRDHDDVARDAGDTIRREVQDRYGIDVDMPGADTAAVTAALAEAERSRAGAAAERKDAGQELTAAQLLFAQAARHEREINDQRRDAHKDDLAEDLGGYEPAVVPENVEPARDAARTEAVQQYDSSERRQAFASSLEARGIDERTIAARIIADGENAKHPREAVTSRSGRATKTRSKSGTVLQLRDRGGLSR